MHNVFVNQVRLPGARAAVDSTTSCMNCAASMWHQRAGRRPASPPAALPEDQRDVLLLVALEELSYAQIATVLGIPTGTVMSRLSRARARLQDLMEGTPAAARGSPWPASPQVIGLLP